MARTPNSHKEETRERILDVAARTIRREGYAGIAIADVMREAGLTHGGFYAHFPSRDALLIAAVERAGLDSVKTLRRACQARAARGHSPFRLFVESYLDESLLRSMEASAVRVRRLIAAIADVMPGFSRAGAGAVAATLIGALQLARTLGDTTEGRAVLGAARKALIEQYDNKVRATGADGRP